MNTPSKDITIKLKTETEHMLYERLTNEHTRFKQERQEREKLQSLVEDLTKQIEILKQQLKCAVETKTTTPSSANMETCSQPAEYSTDEEELAKETEWIRTKARKKRKLHASPTLSPQNKEEKIIKEKTKKVPPPPPIIVDGVKNYQNFYDFLTQNQTSGTFTIKMLNGDSIKVNACNDEAYRTNEVID